MSHKKEYPNSYWHPRYWPTWLMIGALKVTAFLPWKIKMGLGVALGEFGYRFIRRRRHIAETNIALCFPELNEDEQKALVRRIFHANGIGVFETATAWCRDPEHLRDKVIYRGGEYIERAKAKGKGVLVIGIHFSTLDLGGALHALFNKADVVYRPHNNPLFEDFMTKARHGIHNQAIDRHDLRGVVKRLKEGNIVWYSPDQDFGRQVSVFAPFFGVNAATIKLTAKIARLTGSPVVPFMFHRNDDNETYTLEYEPAFENFPSGDDVADATVVNEFIERAIRKHPEQYLWLHRRFKTRPEGEPKLY